MQKRLNAIVGYDEKFNNAIVRHALYLKNDGIFENPNPLKLTFRDVKKFDLQNPTIGKLATPVKASKLFDYDLTKKNLANTEIANIENRLEKLKKQTSFNNSDYFNQFYPKFCLQPLIRKIDFHVLLLDHLISIL